MRARPLAERFNEKWTPEPMSGCWLWMASVTVDGYGAIASGGKVIRAHRVSWEIHRVQIPQDMCVLHHCDNPPCVNPEHLWIGTHEENVKDMVRKGRAWNPTARAMTARTHCPRGHEFDGRNNRGDRFCRRCHNDQSMAYERRRRADRKALSSQGN